jgi:hypothetical protein
MAVLDTFNGSSIQYSYASIDKSGYVIDIVDQKIISQYACSGLYGFGSYEYMYKISVDLLKRSGSASFTQLYEEYLRRSLQVKATYAESSGSTIVLGTPEEYIINIHRFS